MEENLNYIETSLTQSTSFEILHEKIETGVFEMWKFRIRLGLLIPGYSFCVF
jgi:hypothetical protein